ncbi:MAG: phenylalanine--tRNA ligase subunit beta [Flavobacteriaceae bacterium]
MKISHNWLRQFIKIDIPVDEISILLTNLGLEVENIETYESIKGGLKGVVVGKVISCGKHPNADRLKITKVDIGGDSNLSIVCGAPNVARGQKVLVATMGTTLNMFNGSSLKISKGKIRGEISEGMICAEDELGLSDNHDGILVLDKDCKIGEAGASIFNIEEDVIFDIGLTPNRADAMSHMGVARDLRAACILNDIPNEWNLPEISSFHVDNTQSTISIKVEDEHRCPQYHGITITNVKISPSPQWIQNRLKAIGITPKNNVVDVTNYLLHEIGQPLHAFDADKINGDIIVRTCSSKTPFVTLDGNKRELNQEDLMICDNKKAHCIAGVFGGVDSGVEDQTTNVFIESAYFDPISIRKTAKRHGLNTDASFRFERGIDPEIGVYALKRAAILIRDLAGGIISSDIQEVTRPLEDSSKIFLSYTELNKTIGQEIDEKKLNAILNALEIEINSVSESGIGMTIPRYRVDVTRPADVIEEILRIYGYNKILDVPLKYEASPAYQWKSLHKLESTIANKLNGQGFIETINNSLTNPNASGDFYNPVKILNPLGKEFSIMRQSLKINALQVIAFNLNRQNKDLKLYEFGNIYGVKDNNYHESKRLTLSLVGLSLNSHWDLKNPPNLFFYGKGVLIDLFQSLGYDNLNFDETNHPDFDIAFELIHRKKSYGHFGLISKKLKETYNIDEDIYIADLDWNKITEKAFLSSLKYEDVPRFPVMKRDFALLIDKEVSFESLENISYKTERKILKSVQLFDVFEDEKLPKGKKSYGITFTFQDQNKTLTDKHIDKIMEKLKGNFIKEFDAELR